MKHSRSLFGCLALLATASGVFADAPPTNPAPSSSDTAPKEAAANTNAPTATPPSEDSRHRGTNPPGDDAGSPALGDRGLPTEATPQMPATAGLKLDDYIKDLTAALKLTGAEKKKIAAYYVADGVPLKKILNDDALSPLQQARQASDLRDTRNIKIEALLDDLDRQQEFLKIEARYRVALTELAADGGLVAPPVPAAAPKAPAPASPPPATNAPAAAK